MSQLRLWKRLCMCMCMFYKLASLQAFDTSSLCICTLFSMHKLSSDTPCATLRNMHICMVTCVRYTLHVSSSIGFFPADNSTWHMYIRTHAHLVHTYIHSCSVCIYAHRHVYNTHVHSHTHMQTYFHINIKQTNYSGYEYLLS
jgi:hypothetical protein